MGSTQSTWGLISRVPSQTYRNTERRSSASFKMAEKVQRLRVSMIRDQNKKELLRRSPLSDRSLPLFELPRSLASPPARSVRSTPYERTSPECRPSSTRPRRLSSRSSTVARRPDPPILNHERPVPCERDSTSTNSV